MFNIKVLPMTGFEPRTSGLEATALPTDPQPMPWLIVCLSRTKRRASDTNFEVFLLTTERERERERERESKQNKQRVFSIIFLELVFDIKLLVDHKTTSFAAAASKNK